MPILNFYSVREDDRGWNVVSTNGTIVASCALRGTAERAMDALNACAVLPFLSPAAVRSAPSVNSLSGPANSAPDLSGDHAQGIAK